MVVYEKNINAMTLVIVYEKNTHAMTLVDPYVVYEKNTNPVNSSASMWFMTITHIQ